MLFEVVRFEPKQFRQRRPCPDEPGIWIWGLNAGEYMRSGPGRDWITFDEKRFAAWPPTKETKNFGAVRRVPYRLPEVLEAIAQGHEVYIVEGEKDCTNLAALGFTATTNPGGAEKWRDEYNEYFCGAEAVIIGDNDHPGRRHVEGIATSLYRIAKRVRVGDLVHVWPECPEKGDVSDWINKVGGTADQLKAFVQSLPDWEPQKPVVNVGRSEWPKMDEAGYYGLAGDVVKTIEPHSEADPNAILIQFLVAVGNAIGRGPFYKVEGDYHYTKLFVVLVGTTSEGRKGTSLGRVLQIMEQADPDWTQYRVQSGLVSGEGLVHHVRDPVFKLKDGDMVEVDRGVVDKRLLVEAQEFAAVLSVMEKPGNTLSPVTRDAWGHKVLQTLGKASPEKATGSHVSIIAHITEPELKRKLTRTEMANGYANRFMFLKVRRSKMLPHGGNLDEAEVIRLGERVKLAIEGARRIGRVVMTNEAAEAWTKIYGELGAHTLGLSAEVIARAAPQVIRLALIYAVLDNSTEIDLPHLRAALAVWEYCEDSACQIFQDTFGDPIADVIWAALQAAAPEGLGRNDIRGLFSGNQSSSAIGTALNLIAGCGLARKTQVTGERGGRPSEVWFAVGGRR